MTINRVLPPVEVRITYKRGEQLTIRLYTTKQVEDLITGLTSKTNGYYGFTEPGDSYQRVVIARQGILFIQVDGAPEISPPAPDRAEDGGAT